MKGFILGFLTLCIMACEHKSAVAVEDVSDSRIEKVMYLFTTPVRSYYSFLWWDANTSDVVFKDVSGTILRYDKTLGKYVEMPNLRTIRFIVDSISSAYIRDSLRLLPSDLRFVDESVQDDGLGVQWMVTCGDGTFYEGYYNGIGATENHARFARYLLKLTQEQHPDVLAKDYLQSLQNHIQTPFNR